MMNVNLLAVHELIRGILIVTLVLCLNHDLVTPSWECVDMWHKTVKCKEVSKKSVWRMKINFLRIWVWNIKQVEWNFCASNKAIVKNYLSIEILNQKRVVGFVIHYLRDMQDFWTTVKFNIRIKMPPQITLRTIKRNCILCSQFFHIIFILFNLQENFFVLTGNQQTQRWLNVLETVRAWL